VLLRLAPLTENMMIIRKIAFFHSSMTGSLTAPAHQLEELILGVQPGWVSLMQMAFGASVEKSALLILMMVLV
jgi:hypothetical protein